VNTERTFQKVIEADRDIAVESRVAVLKNYLINCQLQRILFDLLIQHRCELDVHVKQIRQAYLILVCCVRNLFQNLIPLLVWLNIRMFCPEFVEYLTNVFLPDVDKCLLDTDAQKKTKKKNRCTTFVRDQSQDFIPFLWRGEHILIWKNSVDKRLLQDLL
jgi:hypothetical protein